MSKILVSIIIPTHNRKLMVKNLIESILASTYKDIEIIVIDDASSDGTYKFLEEKFKNKIKLFRNRINLFAAKSKNIGQKKAKGDFLLFIDDDNCVEKNMISELVKVMQDYPDVGEVGPVNYELSRKKKLLLSGTNRNMWTTKTTHIRNLSSFNGKEAWDAPDIPNAFMVRANVVNDRKIFFRSKYGIMYEESDYAYRIKRSGYRVVFCREAKVYHNVDNDTKDFVSHFVEDPRRSYLFARNRILFHATYSSLVQIIFILLIWVWVFTFAYIVKFFKYKNSKVGFNKKLSAVKNYFFGNLVGIFIVISGRGRIYLSG